MFALLILLAIIVAYLYVCVMYFFVGLLFSISIACMLLPWLTQKEFKNKNEYLNHWFSVFVLCFMGVVLFVVAIVNYPAIADRLKTVADGSAGIGTLFHPVE